jgi:hypothetical protein
MIMLILIVSLLSLITANQIAQSAFNTNQSQKIYSEEYHSDEMSFRLLRPSVPIVDITIPKKICRGGQCKPEGSLDPEKLKLYRAYARVQTVGYCRSVLINEWNCGVCNEPGSPVKNTTDIRFFRTNYHTVHGIMAVNHDLGKIFLVFQGVQHKIQWWVSSRGLIPVRLKAKVSNKTINGNKIRVHSNTLSF